MTRTSDARERPIAADERSGVLYPERLVRYQAGWIDPEPASSAVVDQYWHVAWALAVLSDLTPAQVADTAVPLTADLDPRLHGLMQRIADCTDPAERAQAADEAVRQAVTERAPTSAGHLANDVLDELRERIHHRTGTTLTERFARASGRFSEPASTRSVTDRNGSAVASASKKSPSASRRDRPRNWP